MRKSILKNCFLVIIGSLLTVCISYASTIANGSDVLYSSDETSSKNVNEALDELYSNFQYGDAQSNEILNGRTAIINGTQISGTMINRGSWKSTPATSGNISIPEGYHDGTGYIDTSSIYNSAYSNGYQAGQAGIQAIVANFSGMTIQICAGRGACGGQTYEVNWAFSSDLVLKRDVNPAVFGSITYPYTNNVHWTEGNHGDGVYDCAWNVSYRVSAFDQVTGAEVGRSWAANYPNMLTIKAIWSFNPKGSGCSAYAFTDSVGLVVR